MTAVQQRMCAATVARFACIMHASVFLILLFPLVDVNDFYTLCTNILDLYMLCMCNKTHTHTHPYQFYGPLDFVQDYPGEPVPETIWILLN